MYTGSVILNSPATLAVCLMYRKSIITGQVIHTTIHVDFGAGVVVVAQAIHDGII